jgi:Ser/Thr protein kinase RdoA (MazF antagonist)
MFAAQHEVRRITARVLGVDEAGVHPVGQFPASENLVHRVEVNGQEVVLRLTSVSRRCAAELDAELAWLDLLGARGVAVERPVARDVSGTLALADGGPVRAVVFALVDGSPPDPSTVDERLVYRWGELMGEIHRKGGARVPSLAAARRQWRETANYDTARLADPHAAGAVLDRVLGTPAPEALVHGDLGLANLVRADEQLVAVDFDDACRAPAGYDLAATLFDLLVDHGDRVPIRPLAASIALFAGYRRKAPLADTDLRVIGAFWAALVVERAITPRRLGYADPAADARLAALLLGKCLPEPLEHLKGRLC